MEKDFLKHKRLTAAFYNAISSFGKDECFLLASSISFYFLLSIIPFVALAMIIFSFAAKMISIYVTSDFVVSRVITENIREILPFVSQQWIEQYVVHPGSAKSLTITSLLILPVISSFIFDALEISYRRIFKLPKRHFLLSKTVYLGFIIMIIVLMFLATFFSNILASTIAGLAQTNPYIGKLYGLFVKLPLLFHLNMISPVVFVLFFMVTVAIFLNIKIPLKYQLFSGLLFYFMWFCAKVLFGLYLATISRLTLIYGSLSSIIIILIWVYYSALALLFSVEVLHQLHITQNSDSL